MKGGCREKYIGQKVKRKKINEKEKLYVERR